MHVRYEPLPVSLYARNRERFVAHLPQRSVAIFFSNDQAPRNGDTHHAWRQNSDLFYLSGIDQEESILVLAPDCPIPGMQEVLFLRRTDAHIAVWEGYKYTQDDARKTSGVPTIKWADEFAGSIRTMLLHADTVFLNLNENDRATLHTPYHDLRRAREFREDYPLHDFRRSAPIMQALRVDKQPEEMDAIRRACDITRTTFLNVLRMVKPGVTEYEVEAEVLSGFIRGRATGPAYGSIIASGPNACVLHYVSNNMACQDGHLLLMDFGAEYANYAADLTRTIPVNGKFSPRQRAIYDAVLRVQRQARTLICPGTTLAELNDAVGLLMQEELLSLGLLTQEVVDAANKVEGGLPAYKRYFMHGTSHFLGLDVHDVGNRYAPMQEGMYFSCEPGLYIPEEGIGIRLENNILITAAGFEDTMDNIPIEADEIEDLMAQGK